MFGDSLSAGAVAQMDHAQARAFNERDRRRSSGRSGRHAAGREAAFGTDDDDDDDDAGPFRENEANKTRLKFKLPPASERRQGASSQDSATLRHVFAEFYVPVGDVEEVLPAIVLL